jgi:predicted transcriptional regulator of viral defense system
VCTSTPAYRRKAFTLVAERAAEQFGVLALGELLHCGLSEATVGRWVAAGRLHRLHRGVYAVGHTGLTPESRWLAAVKACGADGLLSHASLMMLFGLLPMEDRRPEVTVPVAQRRAPEGVRVHRTRSLHPDDVWRHHGIPTTSPERLLLDMAPRLTDRALARAMSRAQSMHLTNLRRLGRRLDRAAGRPGRARFARVLAGNPPATRSELEDRVHDLILAGGLTPPDVNVPLRLDGRRVIPDFRWPEQQLIVEADGAGWHDTPQARAEDADRQALLEAHGERVIRVTWQQATAHAAQTLGRIYNAGPGTGPRAASSASPIASTTSSVPAGPTSSIPTGSPSPVRPAGTDSAGSPAPLAGSVLRT